MSSDLAGSYRHIMPVRLWGNATPDLSQLEIDFSYFDYYFQRLSDEEKESLVRRVIRESAAESGALEDLYTLKPGHSRTIALESENWEDILENPSDRASFEDVVHALEYATQWIGEGRPITLSLIREIHAIACKSQATFEVVASISGAARTFSKPLEHGRFKTEQNFVQQRSGKTHVYCPPESVPAEMEKFIDEIESEIFGHISPVVKAAYVHYCLAQIHPFQDGNGRVARVVASMYLVQTYGVPLVVYADRKSTYLQALEAVESGNYRELAQNVADRLAATLAELSQVLLYERGQSPSDQLSSLMKLVEEHSAVAFANVDEIASRLFSEFQQTIYELLQELINGSGGALQLAQPEFYAAIDVDTPPSYRGYNFKIDEDTELPYDYLGYNFRERTTIVLELVKDDIRTGIRGTVHVGVGKALGDSPHFPFAVIASRFSSAKQESRLGSVRVRLEDCFPATGTNVSERVKTLSKLACTEMLDQISKETERRLKQSGSFLGDLGS